MTALVVLLAWLLLGFGAWRVLIRLVRGLERELAEEITKQVGGKRE